MIFRKKIFKVTPTYIQTDRDTYTERHTYTERDTYAHAYTYTCTHILKGGIRDVDREKNEL